MGTIQAAAGRARFRAAEHLTRQGHGHNHNMATHWPNTPNRKRVVFPAMPLKSLIWLVIHEINTYRSGPMWAKTFFRFHAGLVDVIKRDCTSASSFRSWLAICTMSTSNLIHPVRSLQESEASRHGNCNPLGELASTRITIDWQLQAKRKRRKLVGQGEMCSERHGARPLVREYWSWKVGKGRAMRRLAKNGRGWGKKSVRHARSLRMPSICPQLSTIHCSRTTNSS